MAINKELWTINTREKIATYDIYVDTEAQRAALTGMTAGETIFVAATGINYVATGATTSQANGSDDQTGAEVPLTGYVKPAATAAIVPADTANEAIGKLERALDDVPGNVAQTYTVTNVTADRALDADSTSVDEVADVLSTLINDLKTSGIIQ